VYPFEVPRLSGQHTEIEARRPEGLSLSLLNLSTYNYFGYGYHRGDRRGQEALDRYGLGAGSSPVISGTFDIHHRLESELVDFYGLEAAPLRCSPPGTR